MRFGLHFHQYQVPEWAQFYVNYNELKQNLKAIAKQASELGSEPNFGELDANLRKSADVVKTFHTEKYDFVHQKEIEFCRRYGLVLRPSNICGLDDVNTHELKDLFDSFSEIRRDTNKLLWYVRVNQEAVQRISNKFEKFVGPFDPPYNPFKVEYLDTLIACENQYLIDVERLDGVISDINRVYSIERFDYSPKSIYFDKSSFQSLTGPGAVDLEQIIDDSGEETLPNLFEQMHLKEADSDPLQQLDVVAILTSSILHNSSACAHILLEKPWLIRDGWSYIDNNWLNHMITIVGRDSTSTSSDPVDPRIERILAILDLLTPEHIGILQTTDALGRMPIHYSALYGVEKITRWVLGRLEDDAAIEALLTVDNNGSTPLHYAVIGGQSAVTKLFLDIIQTKERVEDSQLGSLLGDLLQIALKARYTNIVELLTSCPFTDLSQKNDRGETAIYVAAQVGFEYPLELFSSSLSHKDSRVLDIPESAYGWTPLIAACAAGHKKAVEILIKAGADPDVTDRQGWIASDHASFQGNLHIAKMLRVYPTSKPIQTPSIQEDALGPLSSMFRIGSSPLKNESLLVINLGSMQARKKATAVDLDCCSSEYTGVPPDDTRFSLEISTPYNRTSHVLRLPLLNDKTEPLVFHVPKSDEVHLRFNLLYAISGMKKGALVGSGIAVLRNDDYSYGADREPLVRLKTVSILAKESMKFMGTVSFTLLLVNPYQGNVAPENSSRVGRGVTKSKSVEIVGHRGLGINSDAIDHLQIRENTIESILAASKLGASFVEFDVQLTKDHVPVIYHNFPFSESGTGVPIHDLTVDQFLHAGESNSIQISPPAEAENEEVVYRPRSLSFTKESGRDTIEVQEKLRYTVDFKSNTNGKVIQDSLATLEDLLVKVPESVGFFIEIKYPRLHDTVFSGTTPIAIELNTYIDAVLETVFRLGKRRTIALSSFTPEACIMLSIKQNRYPVMFITHARKLPLIDYEERVMSIQVAIRFAKLWKLAGIVFGAEMFILGPKLVRYVQRCGLACSTFGVVNNDPENAKVQANAGLDFLIVDKVGPIAKSLKKTSIE